MTKSFPIVFVFLSVCVGMFFGLNAAFTALSVWVQWPLGLAVMAYIIVDVANDDSSS